MFWVIFGGCRELGSLPQLGFSRAEPRGSADSHAQGQRPAGTASCTPEGEGSGLKAGFSFVCLLTKKAFPSKRKL